MAESTYSTIRGVFPSSGYRVLSNKRRFAPLPSPGSELMSRHRSSLRNTTNPVAVTEEERESATEPFTGYGIPEKPGKQGR